MLKKMFFHAAVAINGDVAKSEQNDVQQCTTYSGEQDIFMHVSW